MIEPVYRSVLAGMIGLILLAFPVDTVSASLISDPTPKYEFRAVWITTAHGLDFPTAEPGLLELLESEKRLRDWPHSPMSEPGEQKEELIEIIDDAYQSGLNAMIFQIVSRGDAFYSSERLPWSHLLTGEAGVDPGWDPLEIVIRESRKRGLEVHAWVNVGRIGGADQPFPDQEPFHIYQDEEGWIEDVDGDWWLNTGIPDARTWVVDNITEIVTAYDIDAVHLDFIRYPTGGFESDEATMEQYNESEIDDLDDWRRNNITELQRALYPAIREIRPWVKLGSTPVGHYRQGDVPWPALWGYDSVYQDSRRWLEEEINDYIAPQLYWSTGGEPDFEQLLNTWMSPSHDRHIYIGHAPYIQDVLNELDVQIDLVRASGAQGSIYFRYEHIASTAAGDSPLDVRYADHRALVPPMDWLESEEPDRPVELVADWSEEYDRIHLDWNDVSFETNEGDTLVRYAVYRMESDDPPPIEEMIEEGQFLVGLTGESHYSDRADPTGGPYYYAVTAMNRNNQEGSPSATVRVEPTGLQDEPVVDDYKLQDNYPNPFSTSTRLPFRLAAQSHVAMDLYDITGRHVARLFEGSLGEGHHSVQLDGPSKGLASGVYLYRMIVTDTDSGREVYRDDHTLVYIR